MSETVTRKPVSVGYLIEDWRDLEAMPVGSVVLACHKSYGDVWPWVKTDDTELVDEDGLGRSNAWASVAYSTDRTDADLLIESSAVRVLWLGNDDIRGGVSDAE